MLTIEDIIAGSADAMARSTDPAVVRQVVVMAADLQAIPFKRIAAGLGCSVQDVEADYRAAHHGEVIVERMKWAQRTTLMALKHVGRKGMEAPVLTDPEPGEERPIRVVDEWEVRA